MCRVLVRKLCLRGEYGMNLILSLWSSGRILVLGLWVYREYLFCIVVIGCMVCVWWIVLGMFWIGCSCVVFLFG